MLNPTFVAIGIDRAYVALSDDGWYWTTTFGGEADAEAALCPADAADNPDPAAPKPEQDAAADARSDGDDDGRYDDETDVCGTDPAAFHTVGDGVGDGEEIFNNTDPSTAGRGAVPDGDDADGDRAYRDEDGLFDEDETTVYGTNPDEFDTDGNVAGDGEEVFNGTYLGEDEA